MEIKRQIKRISKTAIFVFLCACMISIVEVVYQEDAFYNNNFVYDKKICPVNWEARLWSPEFRDQINPLNFMLPANQLANGEVIDQLRGTHYEPFIGDAISQNVHGQQSLNEFKQNIDEKIRICTILKNANPDDRILSGTVVVALQPIHLVLGGILYLILKKNSRSFLLMLRNVFLSARSFIFSDRMKKIGYVIRGIYRKQKKYVLRKIKNFEKEGK